MFSVSKICSLYSLPLHDRVLAKKPFIFSNTKKNSFFFLPDFSSKSFCSFPPKNRLIVNDSVLVDYAKQQLRAIEDLLNSSKLEDSIKECDDLIKKLKERSFNSLVAPLLVQTYTYKGKALSKGTLEEEGLALKCFEKAIQIAPNHSTEAKQERASILFDRGISPETGKKLVWIVKNGRSYLVEPKE
jgi:tetratricopeptide (TPR) repeat protein